MTNPKIQYPEKITILPSDNKLDIVVTLPGSKSITNRALVIAALNTGTNETRLTGVLQSEDTEVMIDCLEKLGFFLKVDWESNTIKIQSPLPAGLIPSKKADLFTANSGTTMRFLTAMLGLGHGTYRLDGIARMRERPIGDLLDCLNGLGIHAKSESDNQCPPVLMKPNGWQGGKVSISTGTSSQFLSGILMAAPFSKNDTTITLTGKIVSQPYIDISVKMLQSWGLTVHCISSREFHIPGNQTGTRFDYHIEPDASAASYFYAIAAICQGSVTTPGLGSQSLQGDLNFVKALERMGCTVFQDDHSTRVIGGPLHGIDIDMNTISDTVMTLGIVACFADGPTHIRNVEHIRHKETDRITALATELRKIGATVEEFQDSLIIHPGAFKVADIFTYNDHRMAMSFAVAGLRIPGITILNPSCVSKTYPKFFDDFTLHTKAKLLTS